ncbi:hypothetical protein GIB67_039894 [Kingdonia uniflora]|uniref:Pentatricopeptide repeat-containing protein n=1 Tax=Kingdonia uniflora TaxID=39325 RepID=A0A7J7P3P9_9MAGN|nr:hypothetical protein GIB67_039894 [Kingdonia uniflora]
MAFTRDHLKQTKEKLVSLLKIHRKLNSKKKNNLEMGDSNEQLTTLETTVSILTSTVGELVEQLRLTNLVKASALMKRRELKLFTVANIEDTTVKAITIEGKYLKSDKEDDKIKSGYKLSWKNEHKEEAKGAGSSSKEYHCNHCKASRRYEDALELFEILECEGDYDVGSGTYDALVNACIGLKSIRRVKRVYGYMMRSGVEGDLYLRNRMLLMHVKCGMLIDARRLFAEMTDRNVVSRNTIIGGLVDLGEFNEALDLFLIMWREFDDIGSRTFAMMIRAVAGKCGNIEDAQFVFDGMSEKRLVGWNSFIAGYALHGYSEKALSLCYKMRDLNVKMDHFTHSLIIRICTRLASLEHAKQAHAGLVCHGFGSDTVANTTLVNFYSKWSRIEDARRTFDKMPHKNVISWNALIAGYGKHGRGVEAVEVFEQMLHEGRMAPNHVTFLAVFSACAYSGLSDTG